MAVTYLPAFMQLTVGLRQAGTGRPSEISRELESISAGGGMAADPRGHGWSEENGAPVGWGPAAGPLPQPQPQKPNASSRRALEPSTPSSGIQLPGFESWTPHLLAGDRGS